MDVQFYGANCVALSYKGTRLVVDDNLAGLGGKAVLKNDDVALFTGAHDTPANLSLKLLVDQPGEYEVGPFSILGVAAQSHIDESGLAATMYKIMADDITLLFTGHVSADITDAQLEASGPVDVLFVPVGGNGYTLDPVGALKLIKEIEPKLVIPTHYADKGLNYQVPQQSLEQALKELAMEPAQRTPKLKLKPADLTETTQLIVLEKA